MRALVSHDGWFAPADWLARHHLERKYRTIVDFPTAGKAPPWWRLWLFTDDGEARAAAAAGWAVGTYAGPARGVEIFAALGPDVTELSVNPTAPLERGWFLDGSKFASAAMWVDAVRIEAVLRSGARDTEALVAAYGSFVVLVEPTSRMPQILHLEQPQGDYLPVFTAPDRSEVFAAQARGNAESVGLSGPKVFALATMLPVEGIALNVDGASSFIIPLDVCKRLAT